MLNIEKYKDEIITLMRTSRTDDVLVIFVAIKTGMDYGDISYKEAMEWLLSEYKEPVLNKAEREYLSAVIEPFRDKVKFIKLPSYECLHLTDTCIRMYGDYHCELVKLPSFKIGTMYKGMELDKKYTLEELGL